MADIRPATWDDLEGVFDLRSARNRAAFGMSEVQLAHIRDRWQMPSFEVGRDNWVAVDDGKIVGEAELGSSQEFVHAAQDAGTGDALLARVEERARERGFGWIAVTAVPEDEPLYALVQRNGFALEREILRMWRPLDGELPEPAWPGGVAVRAYTDDDGERVHALLDAAYRGWDDGYVAMSHADWLKFMTDHDEFDPGVWFLVERDGELVAAALHWKESRARGWVKDIVVRDSERGRGLGKALLHHAFREYARRGVERVGLKVDSKNPTGAPQLYERVGFAIDRRYGIWRKDL
ncbi:MAG TPA: GNAT family N-acetyltransferase [Gaiellaceae bacterium]